MPTGDFTTTSNGTGNAWSGWSSSDIKFYFDGSGGTYTVKSQPYTYVPDGNDDVMKMLLEMVKEGDTPTLETLNNKVQEQERRLQRLKLQVKALRKRIKEVANENKDLRESLDVALEGILSLMPTNYQDKLRS